MITQPISFTGRLSLQDALDIHRYHSRVVYGFGVRALVAVVAILIAALIVVAEMRSHFAFGSYVTLAGCAFFSCGWWPVARLDIRWRYHRHRDKYIDHTVTFTNESISTSSAVADIRLDWKQLAAVVVTPRGLLFFVPPHGVWIWLPQREFEGNSHKDEIVTLATEHHVEIRRMK